MCGGSWRVGGRRAGHGYRRARQAVDLWRESSGHASRRVPRAPKEQPSPETLRHPNRWSEAPLESRSARLRARRSHRRGKSSERVRPRAGESLRFRDRGGVRPPRAAEPTPIARTRGATMAMNVLADEQSERTSRARSPTATSVRAPPSRRRCSPRSATRRSTRSSTRRCPTSIREHAPLALGGGRVGDRGARPPARARRRATRCSRR